LAFYLTIDEKKYIIMKKIYLFDLFDLFANTWQMDMDSLNLNKKKFPKDNDENWSKTSEEFETGTHSIKKEIWISTDGTQKYIKTVTESKKPQVDVSVLESELQKAIECENYEKACLLRDEIRKHKKSGI